MMDHKWLRMRGYPTLATAIFLLSSACFVNGIGAQSVDAVEAGSFPTPAAHPAFLVAPSISLGYAPSSVATGDLRQSGKLDLITADCQSGSISVFLGAGQGKFGAAAKYAAGSCPSSIIVADINGDGRPDVLVSNESQGTISVLLGNGDGSLQPLKSYAVGFQPSLVAAGEFDGSGRVDVAVAGASGNHLAILLNDGSGNLQKPVSIPLGKTPTALTVADFNNDGHSDLALANTDGTITILLGQGGAVFHSLADIRIASQSLSSIAFADFNKDGKIDLAVTQPGQKLVSVLMGKGDGTFAPPASYPVGTEAVSTLVADVDGDGIADLVVVNKLSNTFSVLGGNGDGTFKTSLDFVAGNAPLAAVAGDFYGNGHVDLAIINHSSQTVSVPPGNGDGTFKASRSYEAGQQPVSIASGNLNGAKLRGLVVGNYCGSEPACGSSGNVAVFLADDKGDYKLSSTYTVGAGPVSVALADVNGDKNLDIVALNRLDKTVSILLGGGDGTFQRQITIPLEASPIAVSIGDFNKDGNPDLAVLEDCGALKCSQPGSLEILAGKGDGSFQSVSSYAVGYSPSSLAIGDINGDKALDILVANRCGMDASCASPGTATVLIGSGTGKFTTGKDLALGNSPSSIALGNLSGLDLDLLVSRSTDNAVAVLRGNGDGTFKAAVPYQVGGQPGPMVVADFNGDGIADVAVTNFKDSTISVLFGNGDGTLQSATDLPVGTGPVALTAIGASKSKHASLATANGNSGSSTHGTDITVLPNLQPDPPLTSFTLVPAPTSSSVNEGVKLTATLVGKSPNPAPFGTVTFQSNGTDLSDCTGVSITQGVSPSVTSTAICTTHLLMGGSDSLTAVYSGDDVYDPGVGETSPAVVQPVAALAPTLNFTAPTSSTTTAGTAVTFTVQLVSVALTPITPTSSTTPGTVSFVNGITPIANCGAVPISATGSASCQSPPLDAPSATIKVLYTGDNNFNTAANAFPMTVNAGGVASATPISSQPTASVNQTVTFTVTVTNSAGAGAALQPTGSVKFSASGIATPLCATAPIATSTQIATCSYAFSSAIASATITATYNGDTNFSAGTIGTTSQIVNASGTTTSVTSSVASPAVNQQVAFTATVTPAFTVGTAKPTGTVTFATTTGTTLCSALPLSGGVVPVCNYAFAAPGSYNVVANYTSGDANFSGCTSPATCASSLGETVVKATTTTSVVSTPNPSGVNQQVAFTATVTPQYPGTTKPTGSVSFVLASTTATGPQAPAAGTVLCPSAPLTAATNGTVTATCANTLTTFAVQGTYNVIANYSGGDSNFSSCASPSSCASSDAQSVGAATTTVTLTSSPGPNSFVNELVTLNAIINFTGGGSSVPTGTVVYNDGATVLCTFPSSGSSAFPGGIVPACAVPFSSSGTHSLTATFTSSDTGSFGSSPASNVILQSVTGGATTVTLASTPNPSSANQQVAFTATVTPKYTAGTALLSGTVTFTLTSTTAASPAAGTVLCAAAPITTAAGGIGTATCQNLATTFALNGSYTITPTYNSGSTNFAGCSTSSCASVDVQSVGAGATTVTVTSSSAQNTSTVNQPVTLTATITYLSSGTTAVPDGTITFTDADALPGAAPISCPVTAVTGSSTVRSASCTASIFTAGTHPITAVFTSSNSNFSSSPVSGILNQVVKPDPTTTTVTGFTTVSGTPTVSVNELVTFTAVVQPSIAATAGSKPPTGTVSFSYTSGATTLPLCGSSVFTLSGSASSVTATSCQTSLPAQGSYTINATYSGDANFVATGTGSPSVPLQLSVGGTATTLSIVSSSPTITATRSVTFTATVSQAILGPLVTSPTGSVAFSSSDITASAPNGTLGLFCPSVPVNAVVGGTATAKCPVNFPATTDGTISVSAVFTPTPGNLNFLGSSTAAPQLSQVVQDFTLAFSASATSAPVLLTQGFETGSSGTSHGTDPFNPTTISAVLNTFGGFSDPLSFVCTVTAVSAYSTVTNQQIPPGPVTDPSCSVLPSNMANAANATTIYYQVSASANAPVGSYTITLTGLDTNANASTLTQKTTVPVNLDVVGVANALTLAPGVTGTVNATFNTAAALPAGDTLTSFTCGLVVTAPDGKTTYPSSDLTCSGSSTAVKNAETSVAISITPVVSTAAGLQRSRATYLAAFLGLPLIALVGWFGSRKSPRRNFFRFIGLILLMAAASFAVTGCGNGFSSNQQSTQTTSVIPPGSYFVQVIATGQNGVKYYAVVPLTVNSN